MTQRGEFHHTNGWYFSRLAAGSVRIRVATPATEHVIPPGEWPSIVAAVAPEDSAETLDAADRLHRGA